MNSGNVQAAPKRLTQYSIATWSQGQGLLSGSVLSLGQSADGYLLIGTTAGWLQFDGIRFRAPKASRGLSGGSAIILCQLQSPDGTLWLGTNGGGLIRIRGTDLKTFTAAEGLPGPTVNALHLDPVGSLWIGTSKGLAVWRENRITPMGPKDSVWSICDGGDGGLLVASFGQGLSHMAGDRLTRVESLPAREVRTVFRARNGEWWASIPGVGVYHRVNGHWLKLAPERNALLDVWSFAEDRHGHIWIGAGAEGLARWDGQGLEQLSEASGLEHSYVLNVFVDREGNVWTGARSGLSRFRDDFLSSYTTREGLPSNMLGPLVELTPGRWLVGTQNAGAAFWEPSRGVATPIPELRDHKIFAVHRQSPTDYWIGTDRGLVFLQGRQIRLGGSHTKLPSPFVFSIAEAGPAKLWIGTLAGACLYEKGACQSFDFADQLPKQSLFALHVSRDGALWLGYGEGTLCRRDGQGVRCWGDQDGLAGGDVFDFEEDESGTVWVASMNGLARLQDGKLQWLGRRNELPFPAVYGISPDARGNWWLSSGEGLFRTTLADLRQAIEGRARQVKGTHFSTWDGMFSPTATAGIQPAASLDSQGGMWFSTNRGAVRVPPDPPSALPAAPKAVLEEIIVDGQTLSNDANIELSASSRNLELHFTALTLGVPERTRFEYKLDGFDPGWLPVGNRRTAFYSSLPPGSYTFQVRAAGFDGRWGPPSPGVAIQQLPAWWQTSWFQLLALLSAMAAVWLWNRRRLQIAQERFNAVLAERTRIARDLHDTLLGDFTGLSMHLAALAMPPKEAVSAADIERFVQRMEHSLRDARQAIQFLRAGEPPLERFLPLLENLCRGICESKSIELSFQANVALPRLDPPVLDCLQRVIVEAVRNAVKHSGASRISVSVQFEDDNLRATISDNGCGFPEEALQREKSFGIRGMQERATAIGAELLCRGDAGGAVVELRLPDLQARK